MTPPPPLIYDPLVGDWTFDTSSLNNLDAGSLAGAVALNMRGRVHLVPEVAGELRADSVFVTSRFPWCDVQAIALPQEQALYSSLRQHWGSTAGKDRGEAAAITLAARHSYQFVCDDGVGFRTAQRAGQICTMRTTALVVAMVRATWITADDGWHGIDAMVKAGRWLGPIPWTNRAGFDALCQAPGFDACAGLVAAVMTP